MLICPHCQSTFFKVENFTPRDSNYILMGVACSNGHLLTAMDGYNIGILVKGIQKKTDDLESSIRHLEDALQVVNNNVGSVHTNVAELLVKTRK